MNHLWLDGLPEKLQGKNYWIYRPPIVAIYPKREFRRRHEALGFEVYRAKYETQYVSLEKLLGFLRHRLTLGLVERLGLQRFSFLTPLPGYEKVTFLKPT